MKSTEQIKENLVKSPLLDEKKKSNFKIKNFQDLVKLANKDREMELKYDLERNVNLVKFDEGKIDISFNEKLNKNFIKILTEKLLVWTGKRWIISLSKNEGEKTIHEKKLEKINLMIANEQNGEVVEKLKSAFPDAKLINVKEEVNE